jgi:hypothetical protein
LRKEILTIRANSENRQPRKAVLILPNCLVACVVRFLVYVDGSIWREAIKPTEGI